MTEASRNEARTPGAAAVTASGEQAAPAGGARDEELLSIPTTRFGEIRVPRNKVLHFPWGLIGFETVQRFVILERGDGAPFRWLQAVDQSSLAFVIAEPERFFSNYEFSVSPEILQSIALGSLSDAAIAVILVISRQPPSITANLQGPLLLNPDRGLGRQVVLQQSGLSTRHPLPLRPAVADEGPSEQDHGAREEETCSS